MLWMITKFIFCLLAAGALGFIAGWILSSLIKNDKLVEKFSKTKEDYDTQRAELNKAYSDLAAKEEELALSNRKMQQVHKELLMKSMDLEEYQKNAPIAEDPSQLALENNALKEEISEYKYLENENALLHNEIRELSIEKENFLKKLENSNLDSTQSSKAKRKSKNRYKKQQKEIKSLEKALRKSKKRVKDLSIFIEDIGQKEAYKKSKKKRKKDDAIMTFDFNETLADTDIKKLLENDKK